MAPWELGVAHYGARESAEIWLPLERKEKTNWTRYEKYPEYLDPPCKPKLAEPSTMNGYYPMWTQLGRRDEFDLEGRNESARAESESEDIVPSLEHSLEEDESENVLVTPEALVGVDPSFIDEEGEDWIPELDLADGLEICIEELEIWDLNK